MAHPHRDQTLTCAEPHRSKIEPYRPARLLCRQQHLPVLLPGPLLNSLLPSPPPLPSAAPAPTKSTFSSAHSQPRPGPLALSWHCLVRATPVPMHYSQPALWQPPSHSAYKVKQWQPWEVGPLPWATGERTGVATAPRGTQSRGRRSVGERSREYRGAEAWALRPETNRMGAVHPIHGPKGLYPSNETHVCLSYLQLVSVIVL